MFKGANCHERYTVMHIINFDVFFYLCICHTYKLFTHTYVEQTCQDCQLSEDITFFVMYGMLLKQIDCHAKLREITFMTDLLWQLSKMAL